MTKKKETPAPSSAENAQEATTLPVKLKPVRRFLRYNFSEKEIADLGREMAIAGRDRTRLEEDKKRVMSDYKARLDAASADVSKLEDKVNSGYDMREVDCEVLADCPKPGLKTIIRTDTGETVEVQPMSDADKQLLLPIEEGEAAPEKPTNPEDEDFA